MLSRFLKPGAVYNGSRKFSTCSVMQFKVVVTGGAGGIGQPLSLLLKQNPLVTRLVLYDIAPILPGVAIDLSHMNTPAKVTGYKGPETLPEVISEADVVIITAGVSRKPGMTRDDLFITNASIVCNLAECVAKYSPTAIIAIVTNPVNSMVPVACEVMKKALQFDPARILGVTTLDVVRSAAFIGQINCVDPRCVNIPVIGGHAGVTIVPLFSQSDPQVNLTDPKDIDTLTKRIQEAGTEVVKAKAGGGSATLSMAFAGLRITNAILQGLNGEPNIIECAYVQSDLTKATYFASPVMFGRYGIEKNLGFGILSDYEETLLKAAIPILMANIKTGESFVHNI